MDPESGALDIESIIVLIGGTKKRKRERIKSDLMGAREAWA